MPVSWLAGTCSSIYGPQHRALALPQAMQLPAASRLVVSPVAGAAAQRATAQGQHAFPLAVQELYRWPAVQEAAAAALDLRYRLLPYFYTLAQNASETGHPLLRPLWMNFPRETQTKTIDRHALLYLLA